MQKRRGIEATHTEHTRGKTNHPILSTYNHRTLHILALSGIGYVSISSLLSSPSFLSLYTLCYEHFLFLAIPSDCPPFLSLHIALLRLSSGQTYKHLTLTISLSYTGFSQNVTWCSQIFRTIFSTYIGIFISDNSHTYKHGRRNPTVNP